MRPAATRAATVVGGLVVGVIGLTSCAKTTYDTSITAAPAVATTTTSPTGTTAELLTRLVKDASTLSHTITVGGRKGEQAEEIANLWNAASKDVGRTRPELLADFEANVARCQSAARFTRAADADKAYRNLDALVITYFGS